MDVQYLAYIHIIMSCDINAKCMGIARCFGYIINSLPDSVWLANIKRNDLRVVFREEKHVF